MVRSSKWIVGTDPEQSLTEVARVALQGRLKTVQHYIPLAGKKRQADIEFVHQLRVSTRRARAAVQVFRDLLPKRHAKWMKRKLRQLRRAAGAARDLDVLGERLRKIAKQEGSQLKAVLEQLATRRQDAQESLSANCTKAKHRQFKLRARELVEAVRPSEQPDAKFGEAARERLTPLLNTFFAGAAADLSDLKAMHRLRISGKQVRYALELLGGAFEDSFRDELYASIEELQEKLGTINDFATAISTFTDLLNLPDCQDAGAELVELIATEQNLLAAKRHEFEIWWTPERIASLSQRVAAAMVKPARSSTAVQND